MRLDRRILAAVTMVVLLFISSAPAFADNPPPVGSGISISPTLTEYTIKPGESKAIQITLKDVTVDDIVAKASINDFKADGTTGNPQLLTNSAQASPYSIRGFVFGLQDVPLKVGEQKQVTVALQIPKNATPGAYFGVIRYKAVPTSSTKAGGSHEVSLSASVGTLVLITVPGNVHEQVQLSAIKFYANKVTTKSSSFFSHPPGQAGVEVRNLGNGFEQPFGTIQLLNTFGKSVYTYQLNNTTPKGNVLPGSSRIFRDALKNIKEPGHYKLTATVAYGNGSQILVLEKSFWYIPIWLLIIILIFILLLAAGVFLAYRRYKTGVRRTYRRKR